MDAFPEHELFARTSQLRRAAKSVLPIFVEGFRKPTKPDQLNSPIFGSADQCFHQLVLANDLRDCDTTALQTDLEHVSRLLHGYINGLERRS